MKLGIRTSLIAIGVTLQLPLLVYGNCIYKRIADPHQYGFNDQIEAVANANVGYSVDVSIDVLGVGAPGLETGFVYTPYNFDPRIVYHDAGSAGEFGSSVSVTQNSFIFGAPETDVRGKNSGTARVGYRASYDTYWQEVNFLDVNNRDSDYGGTSVAASTLANGVPVFAVGSPYEDDGGKDSGSITVNVALQYTSRGEINYYFDERHSKKIVNPSGEKDGFGSVIAMDETATILVTGAHLRDDRGQNSGAVLVYRRTETYYILEQTILPPDKNSKSYAFGTAVSTDGTHIIVGAPGYSSSRGAVFIYKYSDGGVWELLHTVAPDFVAKGDKFGSVLDLSSTKRFVVGMPLYDQGGKNKGGVAVYHFDDADVTFQTILQAEDGSAGDGFGFSVATDAIYIAVGAPFKKVDGKSNAGSVYLYPASSGCFTDALTPTAAPTTICDTFSSDIITVMENQQVVSDTNGPQTTSGLAELAGSTTYSIVFTYFSWETSELKELFSFVSSNSNKAIYFSVVDDALQVNINSQFFLFRGISPYSTNKVQIAIDGGTIKLFHTSKSGEEVSKVLSLIKSDFSFPSAAEWWMASTSDYAGAKVNNVYVIPDLTTESHECFDYAFRYVFG